MRMLGKNLTLLASVLNIDSKDFGSDAVLAVKLKELDHELK